MMHDFAAVRRRRLDLHGANPARLRERHFSQRLPPDILSVSGHGVRPRIDHQIGLPKLLGELPAILVWPLLGYRQVLRISKRRAFIHPAPDGGDLFVTQRYVVLEFLNADRLVQMPWR